MLHRVLDACGKLGRKRGVKFPNFLVCPTSASITYYRVTFWKYMHFDWLSAMFVSMEHAKSWTTIIRYSKKWKSNIIFLIENNFLLSQAENLEHFSLIIACKEHGELKPLLYFLYKNNITIYIYIYILT